jgi:hypothetical protein
MKDPMDREKLRAVQYQHVDGSFELTFGGTFLLVAISFFLVSRVASSTSSSLGFIPLLVFLGGAFLIDTLVRRFRTQVTYPRTGYISYLPPRPLEHPTRLVIWIGIPLLTVLFIGVLFLKRSAFPAQSQEYISYLLPGFSGLLFSGLFAIVGWKIALPRFYLLAVSALLIDVMLFINGVGGYPAMAWLFGGMGVLLSLSGSVTLWSYLRQTSQPVETPDE